MASLNLSSNGPSITKSYQSIVDAPLPTGPAAASPTYGQWAVFSVSAPLANAFQDSGNKESVLKVQSTGEGELVDLIDEFSDGRIQFAYIKIKDSNSGLPKSALVAWCGEGVPERTKGYFTSHMTAVAKLLHGYHVQITARSDRDLTPESIVQKVADASGSKYSTSSTAPPVAAATKPNIGNKPAFTPTQSSGYALPMRGAPKKDLNVDEDGWGTDAPPVTRTQLEKVSSAYQPTKVNMRELTAQKPSPTAFGTNSDAHEGAVDVVKGAYQPVGKVDIAAIRRQAKDAGASRDDRPETVKGAYEPIGKVDIAAIRAKAQRPEGDAAPAPPPSNRNIEAEEESSPSLAQRSAAFAGDSERLTTMPKPKVANKFGGSAAFTGTKAPAPGGYQSKPSVAAPVGAASKNFADHGGKTPAQLWAEKKARERGSSGSGGALAASGYTGANPVAEQKSGGGQWESGYSGKKWAPVSTTQTGQSTGSAGLTAEHTGESPAGQEAAPSPPPGGISSIRDRFAGAAPMGAPAASGFDRASPEAPEPETRTKPNRGIPIPGLPPATQSTEYATTSLPTPPLQPRSPTPPTPEARDLSPIRVAIPVSKTQVTDAHDEQRAPPPALPTQSIGRAVPAPPSDDEPDAGPDPARVAAQTTVVGGTGPGVPSGHPSDGQGNQAKAEYDYDAAEDNEISLREGEVVTDIQKVDADWWLVTNAEGQTGLVPSNYLVEIEDAEPVSVAQPSAPVRQAAAVAAPPSSQGPTAVAEYDYEAAEDNELSFPEGATITDLEFPDEDWWHGQYQGHAGLFPAAYVKLQE